MRCEWCEWCENDAAHGIVFREGKKMSETRYRPEQRQQACTNCAKRLQERYGVEVRWGDTNQFGRADFPPEAL